MATSTEIQTITHVIGTDGTYSITCRDSAGAVATSVVTTGLEIDLKSFPGQTTAVATESAFNSSTATAGVVSLVIDESDLSTAAPGCYCLYVTHTNSGTTSSFGPFAFVLKPKGN
jgi:hypothetical protein